MSLLMSPLRNQSAAQKPWEGSCHKKPWHYEVCAAIPVMDTWESLQMVVDLLRAQTIRPFFVIIDTGSLSQNWEKIDAMRAEDLEVHSIRLNGVKHPSDYPAMAMDLAMSLCRSPYMLATHADCFSMKKTLVEETLQLCKTISPAVGYEITPRGHDDWHGMVSHTWTMLDMKVMDEIGIGWGLRRLGRLFNIEDHSPDPTRPNWPDTELLLNYLLRDNQIEPFLMGKEENFTRNKDENIDHCRTLTGGLLYSREYYTKAMGWLEDALGQARERLKNWTEPNS